MSHPKLSALLNNCLLHALTPEIKAEVTRLTSNDYDNHHKEGYHRLKTLFAHQYGFDPVDFTWDQFHQILNCYNEFDTQVLLGPVLRSFMKAPIDLIDEDALIAEAEAVAECSVEEYKQRITDINLATGRYDSLSPQQVSEFVCHELGLSLEYHPQGNPTILLEAPLPIATVAVHHQGGIEGAGSGGHWERTPNGEQSTNCEHLKSTQLKRITAFFGEQEALNHFGFGLLAKHVQFTANAIAQHKPFIEELYEIDCSAEQVAQYLFNIKNVPKPFAIQLLGEPITKDAKEFIRQYEFTEILDRTYEEYIKASPLAKPPIDDNQQQIVNRLTTPALSYVELKFQKQIRKLEHKIENLEMRRNKEQKRGHSHKLTELNKACTEASKLRTELSAAGERYFANPTTEGFQTFKTSVKGAIVIAHTVLDKHRGWSEFLINLALGLTTLGVGLIVKGAINLANNRSFFFAVHTDSEKVLDDTEKGLEQIQDAMNLPN